MEVKGVLKKKMIQSGDFKNSIWNIHQKLDSSQSVSEFFNNQHT